MTGKERLGLRQRKQAEVRGHITRVLAVYLCQYVQPWFREQKDTLTSDLACMTAASIRTMVKLRPSYRLHILTASKADACLTLRCEGLH